MIIRLIFCLFVLSLSGFAQKSGSDALGDSVVARVGDRDITIKEFMDGYEFGPAFPKRKADSKSVYLKYLINENLLSLDAESRGLDTAEIFRTVYQDIYNDVLTEALYRQEIEPRVVLSDRAIEKGIAAHNFEIRLKWIFCETERQTSEAVELLKKGVSFDTLFVRTLAPDVLPDERQLTTTQFNLFKKNPVLAAIVDTLREGLISRPIQGADGWYIVRIEEINRNGIVTESNYGRAKQEVRNYLLKSTLDKESDHYVDSLMRKSASVIDGDVFRIARAYVAKFELPSKSFVEWQMGESAGKAIEKLKSSGKEFKTQPLVTSAAKNFLLDDFIAWFSSREPYLKFPSYGKQAFSREVEINIWKMVRDNLLTGEAAAKGLTENTEVLQTARLWKNKILYAISRDELMNSIAAPGKKENQMLNSSKKASQLNSEASSAINKKLGLLKKTYKVIINTEVLEKIAVSEENNPKAVDVFAAKRGGVFPHPAFPSIDQLWSAWE